ncbi:thiamine-phosphate kinase [soil metagenome]
MAMLTREQVLVKKIKQWTESSYIGDDCAVLQGGKLVSTDTLVEGTHFRLDFTDWRKLGWKSCAVNLSDVAAMAGRPQYLTVALTLPPEPESKRLPTLEDNLEQFYMGFSQCAKSFGVDIVGGDLTVGPLLVINVTVIGESHEAGMLMRSGAQPGDVVIVTGQFGSSAAGLQLLLQGKAVTFSGGPREELLTAHLEPAPRLREAWTLVELVGSRGSLMDASDGLGDALWQIAEQSQVDIETDLESLPLSAAMLDFAKLSAVDPYQWALYGGEDYELVATISASDWSKAQWQADQNNTNFPFKKIGVVLASPSESGDNSLERARVRLLSTGRGDDCGNSVVNLSNCFKHF